MGIFCMVFGVIVFLGFTGGGFLLANAAYRRGSELLRRRVADHVPRHAHRHPLPTSSSARFIGLLIGLAFFMQGLTYQKVSKIARRRRER